MILDEPVVEFVSIDFSNQVLTASPCPDWASQTPTGGGQRCYASQEDARDCADYDELIPWSDAEN